METAVMRVIGIVLTLVGIVGFFESFPGFLDLTTTHNLVFLVTGLLTLGATTQAKYSTMTWNVFGIVYLLLGIIGLFTTNLWGIMNLEVAGTVIHFILAAVYLFMGYKGTS